MKQESYNNEYLKSESARDKAILTFAADDFGYINLAMHLSLDIRKNLIGESSYIIGINAKWGEGKTSLLNLIKRSLLVWQQHHEDFEKFKTPKEIKDKTIELESKLSNSNKIKHVYSKSRIAFMIVSFICIICYFISKVNWSLELILNNWPALIFSLFLSFAICIFQELRRPFIYCQSKLLKILEKPNNSGFNIVEFNPWTYETPEEIIKNFFTTLSLNIGLKTELGSLLNAYGKALYKDFKFLDNVYSLSSNTLELKKEIINHLEEKNKVPQKTVVIIDDLDRMDDKKVLAVLKTVKLIADFPNTVYLLAYDKSKIENNNSIPKGYLEKIIQYETPLPLIEEDNLCKMLKDFLVTKLDSELEEDLIIILCQDLLKAGTDNIRQLKKFMHSIEQNFKTRDIGNICKTQLVILSHFYIFNPDIYEFIKDSKKTILGNNEIKENEIFESFIGNHAKSKLLVALSDKFSSVLNLNESKEGKSYSLELFYGNSIGSKEYTVPIRKNINRLMLEVNYDNYFKVVVEIQDDYMTRAKEVTQSVDNSYKYWNKLSKLTYNKPAHLKKYLLSVNSLSDAVAIISAFLNLTDLEIKNWGLSLTDDLYNCCKELSNINDLDIIIKLSYTIINKIQSLEDKVNCPLFTTKLVKKIFEQSQQSKIGFKESIQLSLQKLVDALIKALPLQLQNNDISLLYLPFEIYKLEDFIKQNSYDVSFFFDYESYFLSALKDESLLIKSLNVFVEESNNNSFSIKHQGLTYKKCFSSNLKDLKNLLLNIYADASNSSFIRGSAQELATEVLGFNVNDLNMMNNVDLKNINESHYNQELTKLLNKLTNSNSSEIDLFRKAITKYKKEDELDREYNNLIEKIESALMEPNIKEIMPKIIDYSEVLCIANIYNYEKIINVVNNIINDKIQDIEKKKAVSLKKEKTNYNLSKNNIIKELDSNEIKRVLKINIIPTIKNLLHSRSYKQTKNLILNNLLNSNSSRNKQNILETITRLENIDTDIKRIESEAINEIKYFEELLEKFKDLKSLQNKEQLEVNA